MRRGYVFFITTTLLFAVLTSPFEVTCPLDKGTGTIVGTMGMAVKSVEATQLEHRTFEMGCATIWDEFTYKVTVTLENTLTAPGFGTAMVKFYEPLAIGQVFASLEEAIQQKYVEAESLEEIMLTEEISTEGKLVVPVRSQRETKLLFFGVPANSTKTIEDTITIWGWEWDEEEHVVTAVLVNQTMCPYCKGTGKLPITEWLKIKAGVY